jgi:hypothetical protein
VERVKNLFMGQFNFNRQTYILRRYAYSEKQAKALFVKALAKKHDLPERAVWAYFDGEKQNYSIQVETEWRETP